MTWPSGWWRSGAAADEVIRTVVGEWEGGTLVRSAERTMKSRVLRLLVALFFLP